MNMRTKTKAAKGLLEPIAEDLTHDDIGKAVGKNIRMRRKRHKMSLAVLAAKLGFSPQYLSRVELGQGDLYPSTLDDLSGIFNCSAEDLFAGLPETHGKRKLSVISSETAAVRKFMASPEGIEFNLLAMNLPYKRRRTVIALAKELANG